MPPALGKPHRPVRLLGMLGFLAALWACHLNNAGGGDVFMDLEGDSSWLQYDSLLITLRDSDGKTLDTLFHGKLGSLEDLRRLAADGYDGGTVEIVIEGYGDGRKVYVEIRKFDGKSVVERSFQHLGAALDVRPDALRLYVGGKKDTLRPNAPWSAAQVTWSSGNDSIATVSAAGVVTPVRAGSTVVRAAASDSLRDSSRVQVVLDPPVLDVGSPDTSALVGSVLRFRVRVAQEHGGVAAFAWDLDGDRRWDDSGKGFPDTQTVFFATERRYSQAGPFEIGFYVRDGEGNVATATKRLTVANQVPSIDSISPDAVITIRDSVPFAARVSVNAGTLSHYTWDYRGDGKADDSAALSGSSARIAGGHRFPDSGVFKSRLRVVDDKGVGVTREVTVRVKLDRPVADAGGDQAVAPGARVALRGTGTDTLGRIARREWKVGSGAFVQVDSTGAHAFDAPGSPGLIPCVFRVTDDDDLASEDTALVTVTDAKVPAIDSLGAGRTLISIKDSVAFSARVRSGAGTQQRFAWDFDGDGAADRSGTFTGDGGLSAGFRFLAPGVFKVKLEVTDSAGVKVSRDVEVDVRRARPTANAGQDTAVRVRARVELRGTAVDSLDGVIVRREWRIGNGAFIAVDSSGRHAFTAPDTPGIVACLFRVTDDDSVTHEDALTVTVSPSANADLSALSISAGTLAPSFAAAVTEYKDSVNNAVASVTVTSRAADSGAAITVNDSAVASGTASRPIALAEGAETSIAVKVTARDDSTVKTYTIRVFRRPKPGIPLVSGPGSPSNDATPTWTWKTAGGTGTFRYKLGDSTLAGAAETTDTSFTPAMNLADGAHTLYVQERAAGGQWSGSGRFTVRVDATPPAAPSVRVSPPSPTNNTLPTWSWSSGGNGGSGNYRYRLDNSDVAGNPTHATDTTFRPPTDLAAGTHTLFVQERDSAGNWSASGSAQIRIDVTAPNAPSVNGPASPSNDATPTWTWSSGGGGGSGNYRYKLDNSNLDIGATQTGSLTFTSQALAGGNHTLYVQERDSAGNWSASGSFQVTLDLTPPGIPAFAATPRSPLNSLLPTWTWSSGGNGNGVYQVKVDNSDFSTGATTINPPNRSHTPSSALGEGLHTLYVRERDSAGNWSQPASRALYLSPRGHVDAVDFVTGAFSHDLVVTSRGIVYFAYALSSGFRVMRASGNRFELVGSWSGADFSGSIKMALGHTDLPMVALDSANTSAIYAYTGTGTSWTGMGFVTGFDGVVSVNATGTTYLAYQGEDNTGFRGLLLSRYDGARRWTTANTDRPLDNPFGFDLVVSSKGDPIVAVRNGLDQNVRVRTLDGAGRWVNVGQSIAGGSTQGPVLKADRDDRLFLLLHDAFDNYEIFHLSANSWASFAKGPGNVGLADMALGEGGNPYVAYTNSGANDALHVRGYFSGTWLSVGAAYASPGGGRISSPALWIAPQGVPYVGFNRPSNAKNVFRTAFDP